MKKKLSYLIKIFKKGFKKGYREAKRGEDIYTINFNELKTVMLQMGISMRKTKRGVNFRRFTSGKTGTSSLFISLKGGGK